LAYDAPAAIPAAPPVENVAIEASDGTLIYGTYYPAYEARAIVLLFHQAGASREEYATVAPKLAAAGYSALAIDQRSGGDMFGHNETAAEQPLPASYLDARKDIEAALAWSRRMEVPVFLVGSSYSSALVLLVAADHPGQVAGVASFSPGEYLGRDGLVREAAARVRVPTLIVTTAEAGERLRCGPIVAALRHAGAELEYEPLVQGKHGAAVLIEAMNPGGARASFGILLRWLWRYTEPATRA
ncbi:MAG TPA: alpha/beta hydrolase, partial [Sphingomonas sp.]|nr:alpha/beta hydrolase [Sphingomonas sp.]